MISFHSEKSLKIYVTIPSKQLLIQIQHSTIEILERNVKYVQSQQ